MPSSFSKMAFWSTNRLDYVCPQECRYVTWQDLEKFARFLFALIGMAVKKLKNSHLPFYIKKPYHVIEVQSGGRQGYVRV